MHTDFMPILMAGGYTKRDARYIATAIEDCIINGGKFFVVPGALPPSVLGELKDDMVIGRSMRDGTETTGKRLLAKSDFKTLGVGMNYRLLREIRRDESIVGVRLDPATDLLVLPPTPVRFQSLPLMGTGFSFGGVVTSGEDIHSVVTYTPTIGSVPTLVCPSYA